VISFQDYIELRQAGESEAIEKVISDWQTQTIYSRAIIADEYDRQENTTIKNFIQQIYSLNGKKIENYTASNKKIASNFFARLNIQRNTYSLGNGVTFSRDGVKEKFGKKLDTNLFDIGYYSIIHGLAFAFWSEGLQLLKVTEFAPLWDEDTGALKAGIRFWKVDENKPLNIVVYEEDGLTRWQKKDGTYSLKQEKRGYIEKREYTQAEGENLIGYENYSALPIFPLWGSRKKQSTLVGMRSQIDAYDLIKSGFANDLTECAQIYWLVENYGGMTEDDLAKFRDRILFNHIAEVDSSQGGKVTPYTQEVPSQARETFLSGIRKDIYESYGGLDVHAVSANSTNDHLDAAYQPLDENADDFEMQVIEFIQRVGAMLGLTEEEATPIFKRNRIVNQREITDMVMLCASYLDEDTILKKLPFLTVDEIEEIKKNKAEEDLDKFKEIEEESEDELNEEEGQRIN